MTVTMEALLAQLQGAQSEIKGMREDVSGLRNPDLAGARPLPAQQVLAETVKATREQRWGFKSLGHMAHALIASNERPREHPAFKEYLKAAEAWSKTLPTGLNETVGSDGSVLVPPAFASQLLMRIYSNDLLSRTMMFPMSSNLLTIPAVDESSRAQGSRYGGVTHYWEGEANPLTESKGKFAEVDLRPSDLTVFIKATNNLIKDAPALETFINTVAMSELQFGIGNAIVNGNGTRKPQGLLRSPALVSVAVETGQTASTPLMPENLAKMYARLHSGCVPTSVWLMTQSLYADLMLMTIGQGVSNIPVMLPNQSMAGAPYGSILGRPILPVEFTSKKNTQGDIILTDLGQYVTGQIGGTEIASSIHLHFDTRETVFRFVVRLDGKTWWTSALQPANSDETQSMVVCLDTRS